MKIEAKSNCKINLNLKIKGINEGYHLLESVFYPIDLVDELTFELIDAYDDEIIGMDLPKAANIIYKTISEFKKRFKVCGFIRVTVKKNIPIEAGLGGGSSNAAFTIKALNELFKLKLSDQEMIDFGKTIGSDVPFFIINKPSLVTGRGEIVTPLSDFKKIYGIIVFDDIYMSTKEVFQRYDALSIEGLICNKDDNENDLEQAAFSLPGGNKIKEIKADLTKCGCVKALMSGSGGSVVGLCKKEQLNEIYNLAKRKYQRVWKFESI